MESAVAQICREGGARVSTNVLLGDLCGRTTLFGGCQMALDATLVSPFHGDGTHRRRTITDVAVHVGVVTALLVVIAGVFEFVGGSHRVTKST